MILCSWEACVLLTFICLFGWVHLCLTVEPATSVNQGAKAVRGRIRLLFRDGHLLTQVMNDRPQLFAAADLYHQLLLCLASDGEFHSAHTIWSNNALTNSNTGEENVIWTERSSPTCTMHSSRLQFILACLYRGLWDGSLQPPPFLCTLNTQIVLASYLQRKFFWWNNIWNSWNWPRKWINSDPNSNHVIGTYYFGGHISNNCEIKLASCRIRIKGTRLKLKALLVTDIGVL
jgi:hypothetical protein